KLANGDPADFERQAVWSNSVPIFDKDTTVPLFDDETGIVKFKYVNMKVDKGWKTDITEIDGLPKGAVITIVGDTSLVANKYVKDNANFDLASNTDFNLKSGGKLVLKVQDSGVAK